MKLLVLPALFSSRHDDPRLQMPWNLLQLSLVALPFSSLLGSLGVVGVAIALWGQRFHRIIRRPVNQAFAVLSLLLLLGTVFALKPGEAAIGLANFLPFFFVFAGLSELVQTAEQFRRLAQIVVFGSIPVVVIGLGQQFLGWSGHVQWLWILADWNVAPTGNPPGRMASLFYYANVLASYLVITSILNLGLWVEAQHLPKSTGAAALVGLLRTNRRIPTPTPYFLGLTITLLGNTLALIFTNSRNAWIVAILAWIAFAVYRGWRFILVGIGAIVTATLGAAFAPAPIQSGFRQIVPAFFWARLNDQMYPNRPVADLRSTQWNFAWELAQQRPWTGWGLRHFSPLYEAKMQFFIGHPHNLFLMLAAETGLPATLLLFAIAGWITLQGCLKLVAPTPFSWSRQGSSRLPFTSSLGASPRISLPLFTLITTFLAISLFSFLDITLFDVRINILGWLLLASLNGIACLGGNSQVRVIPRGWGYN
jgi:O-antigen ligase